MDININPSQIRGVVNAPSSKSYAHRHIIASFLSKENTFIKNVTLSKDVLATLNALKPLGLNYSLEDDGVAISYSKKDEYAVLDCGESGSTLRFLFPIACALGIKSKFIGSERLMSRPMDSLINCLNENGANIEKFTVNGKIKSGIYTISGDISSQFITGLLFALPLLDGDSQIIIQNTIVSIDYINVTLDVLKDYGINIERKDNVFYVKGNQKYTALKNAVVEGDYSGAAFLLCLGALGEGVKVLNLKVNSCQGDRKIIEILKKFGAVVEEVDGGYFVKKGQLNAVQIDCENIPDIVQILSVVASFSKGKSVFKNVSRLQIKESDRIKGIVDNLAKANIKAEYQKGDLIVYGGQVKGGTFNGDNDHRTVMSAAVLSAYASGNSKIIGCEVVDKSYPNFFKDYALLGGIINGDI